MKVLSLKEPYASLIKEGIKLVETRSWKTNYRGEIYIHASLTKEKTNHKHDDFFKLTENLNKNPGYILCKVNLVDCILMDESFIENLKNNNNKEYLCGSYEIGRYAWVLENIEVIKPIKAKGQLGIWNFNENI